MKNIKFPAFIAAVLFSLALSSCFASAIDVTPVFNYETSILSYVELGSNQSTRTAIMSFYQSSQNWQLVITASPSDTPPYDDIAIHVSCNGGLQAADFNTSEYADWNSSGKLVIYMPYQSATVDVRYNTITQIAKFSQCEFSIYSNAFYGNAPYNSIKVEMIPMLAVIEFINCTDVNTGLIGIANNMNGFFSMGGQVWDMLWYVYSISIIIFALFGIPLIVFLLLRWGIYRLSGVRLGGQKSYYK